MTIYTKILLKARLIRSRATWYEKGKKSSKYFLNLKGHKKAKSSLCKVFNTLVTDPKNVMHEIEKFFSALYKNDCFNPSRNSLDSILENPEIPRLTVLDL